MYAMLHLQLLALEQLKAYPSVEETTELLMNLSFLHLEVPLLLGEISLSMLETMMHMYNGQGIATIGDLSQDRTIALDLNTLGQINGNALADGDMFLVLDADVNVHKRILYRNNGVPIINESTTSRVASNTDLNKYIRFTNSGANTFTLNDSVGVTGNVIIIEQANTGQVTVNGSAQVNSAFLPTTRTQYSVIVLVCVQGGGAAVWTLYGDADE
jgi:hypothetical protein